MLIPLFSLTVSSCGDDNDEPNDSNSQTSVSEEILINSYTDLEFYTDSKYAYKFGVQGNGVDLSVYTGDGNGEYELSKSNFKVDGKWVCGMKKYENKGNSFESFSTTLTNYTDTPETIIGAPNRGDLYAVFVRTATGEYKHYKILIKELAFDRGKNGLINGVKWIKVVYMSY